MVHSCDNRWRNTYRRRIFGYTASITMPPPARARIDFFDSLNVTDNVTDSQAWHVFPIRDSLGIKLPVPIRAGTAFLRG